MAVTVERFLVDSAEARELFTKMWAEVDEIYGNDAPSGVELPGMNVPRAVFVISRDGDETVGCGAIRPLNETVAEVKRIYVAPARRGQGIARQIMLTLEQRARENGFSETWLETGLRQPAAIRLYENLGYTRIAGFGDYKDDPLSVCYAKRLS
ncbi:MAG: GNAT family N-acetyltransferase [Verrucomicrobiota bacterium]|nr:GNAT family N-acetyltransferase [Verrucomicrobiota bacterium]